KAAVARLAGGTTAGDARWLVAAIPTTYSGSEVTPVFGTTDVVHGRKEVVRNPGIRPRLVLYDPELAIDTPPDLTAGTGINALAHCVEGLYSNDGGDEERAMASRAAHQFAARRRTSFVSSGYLARSGNSGPRRPTCQPLLQPRSNATRSAGTRVRCVTLEMR